MNKREKEIFQLDLDNEDKVLSDLERIYQKAMRDIENKIKLLQSDELTNSRIYQIQYQKALKGQIEGILEKLHGDEYSTIQKYLSDTYTNGFVGTMYAMHGQGVPVMIPIDRRAAVKAVVTDSKLSVDLYAALGYDMDKLKKHVREEITRGIATSLTYEQIANNISGYTSVPFANAKRIARTEGHRIQQASADDARKKAKAKGADVVKQWDASLDGATRPLHRRLDGQIREIDEPFEAGGYKVMYPGKFGKPGQDCNCRCVALTRARSALDEKELDTLRKRAEFFGLDKTEDFEDFKKKYLKAAEAVEKEEKYQSKFVPAKTLEEAEEYAQRFVDKYKSERTGKVSYKGMDLEYANAMNKALTEVHDRYELKYPIRNILPINFRDKRFKDATMEAAYQWGSGDLFFNQKYFKSGKTYAAHMKEIDGLMGTVLGGIDKLMSKSGLSSEKMMYLQALKDTEAQCFSQRTDDFVGATFIHELGHFLDDRIFGKAIRTKGIDMAASRAQFAPGISGYATTTKQEYIAESFTAFWYGRADLVDPDLAEVFKELMK